MSPLEIAKEVRDIRRGMIETDMGLRDVFQAVREHIENAKVQRRAQERSDARALGANPDLYE